MSGPYVPQRIATDEEIIDAIREYHAEHGYAPTVREIGDRLGFASTATVFQHLSRLRRQGKVDWVDGQVRTLHVKKRRRTVDAS